MLERLNTHRLTLAVLGGLTTLAAVVLIMAPSEQTLGSAVKLVFIHGALTLAGMLGFYLAGLIGIGVIFTGRELLQRWAQTIGWVGLGLYLAGTLVSLPTQAVTWGNIAWAEPRVRVVINGLVLGVIVLVANTMIPNIRVRGSLSAALAIFLAWATYSADLVLHPDNPIGESPSMGIRISFGLLLGLCLLAMGWIVWRTQKETPLAPEETI